MDTEHSLVDSIIFELKTIRQVLGVACPGVDEIVDIDEAIINLKETQQRISTLPTIQSPII